MNRQGIEGVPAHLKVIAFREPKTGEHYLIPNWDTAFKAACPSAAYVSASQIVKPDNVYGVYYLADVKIPEGYEFVEFREPVEDDHFIRSSGRGVSHFHAGYTLTGYREDRRRIIVKPVAKKTKRVLVVEREINDAVGTLVSELGLRYNRLDGSIAYVPFRIEEREVS